MRNGLAVDFPPLQSVADEQIHLVDRYAQSECIVRHERCKQILFTRQTELKLPHEKGRHSLGREAGGNDPVLRANARMDPHDHVHVRRCEMWPVRMNGGHGVLLFFRLGQGHYGRPQPAAP